MLSISTVVILILLAVTIWAWSSNLKSREIAIRAAKNACEQYSLQLLDGTTHFYKCRPKRNQRGVLGITRFYYFDFFDGDLRHQGRITTFGLKVISVELDSIDKNRNTSSNTDTNTHTHTDNVIQFPSSNKRDV